ncbi:MAG: PaaX family transcriptional regulator C-terminal domain-containing protein [Myxococcota bacterium]
MALLQAFRCDVPVQILIRAASLFDIDENRTRVALHRLRAKGLIESHERGSYRVNPNSIVYVEAFGWRNALQRIRPWDGHWIGVHTAPLPRADKTIARRRDRATEMVGMRELAQGLLVRPDNLVGGVDAARTRLVTLGLEPEAVVFRLDSLGPHDEPARKLWDDLDLDRRYREHVARLDALSERFAAMTVDEAARQSFLIGGRAVQDIVLDPLLPEPLVDAALRDRFIRTMAAFDDRARDAWGRTLGTELTLRQAPNAWMAPGTSLD